MSDPRIIWQLQALAHMVAIQSFTSAPWQITGQRHAYDANLGRSDVRLFGN